MGVPPESPGILIPLACSTGWGWPGRRSGPAILGGLVPAHGAQGEAAALDRGLIGHARGEELERKAFRGGQAHGVGAAAGSVPSCTGSASPAAAGGRRGRSAAPGLDGGGARAPGRRRPTSGPSPLCPGQSRATAQEFGLTSAQDGVESDLRPDRAQHFRAVARRLRQPRVEQLVEAVAHFTRGDRQAVAQLLDSFGRSRQQSPPVGGAASPSPLGGGRGSSTSARCRGRWLRPPSGPRGSGALRPGHCRASHPGRGTPMPGRRSPGPGPRS